MTEWQPIATAPARLLVLLFSQPYGYNRLGEYAVGYVNVEWKDNPEYKYSHWMPLPEPPKEIEND